MDTIRPEFAMKELMASPSLLPEGRSGELCKKILQYLGSNKIYLDKRLSLAKFSSVVGTNTIYCLYISVYKLFIYNIGHWRVTAIILGNVSFLRKRTKNR